MRDEQDHLQLFDLIARDWRIDGVVQQITFNGDDSAAAFACADGAVYLAAAADKSSPESRTRRAVDTGRLTIAPRDKPFAPLKVAEFTKGRSTPVVPHGALNFAFGKDTGRINTLTPGGIATHLPAKGSGTVAAVACSPDGRTLAYACGRDVCVTPASADDAQVRTLAEAVTGLAFSPDGRTLAVTQGGGQSGGVSRWPLDVPNRAAVHTEVAGMPTGVSWRRDGAWLAIRLEEDGFALISAATGAVTRQRNFPAAVRSIDFGLTTDTVVASGAFRVAGWRLADHGGVVTGKPGLVLIEAVAACPTRNLIAVGYSNGLISLAEIGRPSEILLREDTGAGITAMAWSGNGSFLALAGTDGSVALVQFPDSMFKS